MCLCAGDSLGLRVVLGPDPLELVQVMRPEDGPITCQIVKVIHDDGDKQVDDLKNVEVRFALLCVFKRRLCHKNAPNAHFKCALLLANLESASQVSLRTLVSQDALRFAASAFLDETLLTKHRHLVAT